MLPDKLYSPDVHFLETYFGSKGGEKSYTTYLVEISNKLVWSSPL